MEADETWVATAGSKKHDDDEPPVRGRGGKQQKVIGDVARDGKVVAKPTERGLYRLVPRLLNFSKERSGKRVELFAAEIVPLGC
ncbi:MAG: hypothetical protein OXL96_28715 [Candidatus Poribacteria bacterium]|nr:hypothetical protein [Candidatus Poribacteria bacterium]